MAICLSDCMSDILIDFVQPVMAAVTCQMASCCIVQFRGLFYKTLRRSTPWTSRQLNTGLIYRDKKLFMRTVTYRQFKVNDSHNLHVFGLWQEEPGYPERTHTGTGRTCILPTERPCLSWESHTALFTPSATFSTL